MDPTQQYIVDALKKSDEPMTITQISETIGHDRHTVAKHMQSLESIGTVGYKSVGKAKMYKLMPSPLASILQSNSLLKDEIEKVLKAAKVTIRLKAPELKTTWSNKKEISPCYEQVGNKCKCRSCPVEKSFNDGKTHSSTVNGHKITAEPVVDDHGKTVAVFEVVE